MPRFKTCLKSVIFVSSVFLMAGSSAAQSSERVFSLAYQDDLKQAISYMDAANYSKAEKELKSLRKERGLSAYERSTVEAMLGSAYYKQGDLGDAREHYQLAINAGGLLPAEALSYEYSIAQILIAEKQYSEGATRLEAWVRQTQQATSKNTKLIMQSWIQAGENAKALPWAERWFDGLAEKSRKDYDVMNYLYSQTQASSKQLNIVEQMISRWPEERALWDNKLALQAASGQNEAAYQTFENMYEKGLLRREADLLKLAKFHEYYKNYAKGAEVMSTAMTNGSVKSSKDNQAYLEQLQTQASMQTP